MNFKIEISNSHNDKIRSNLKGNDLEIYTNLNQLRKSGFNHYIVNSGNLNSLDLFNLI